MMSDGLQMLREAQRVAVVSHVSPDGDTLGSGCALCEALRQMGKDVVYYCASALPENEAALPGADAITDDAAQVDGVDVVVAVDCADAGRMGAAADHVRDTPLVVIDHHGSNPAFGTVNYIRPDAGSTCEILYDLLLDMGVTMTVDMADCLYTGIITDTGRFTYEVTTPHSLRVAAALMELGCHYAAIAEREFRTRTCGKTRLIGAALGGMELTAGNRVAFLTVTQDMLSDTGAVNTDTEGLVNYGIEIDSVLASCMLYERLDGRWKVSLRGKGACLVDGVAVALGGGGHKYAAGVTLEGSLAEIKDKLLQGIIAQLGDL